MNKISRLTAVKMLITQFALLKENDPGRWPAKFRSHGSMTECNFGGLLIILSNDGESAIVWRDWAGSAIDCEFQVCEICNWYLDATDEIQIGDSYIKFQGEFVPINNFMRSNY